MNMIQHRSYLVDDTCKCVSTQPVKSLGFALATGFLTHPLTTRRASAGDELPESDMAGRVSWSGRLDPPAYGTIEGTQPARSRGNQPGVQSTLYSVVLLSKCSLSASAKPGLDRFPVNAFEKRLDKL
ncbi:MAG: hypothetical protein NTY86_05785 [Deltaproteobacteria bacterium]|nr:hypothetical protein [Deltaproteobacteria bacterium]